MSYEAERTNAVQNYQPGDPTTIRACYDKDNVGIGMPSKLPHTSCINNMNPSYYQAYQAYPYTINNNYGYPQWNATQFTFPCKSNLYLTPSVQRPTTACMAYPHTDPQAIYSENMRKLQFLQLGYRAQVNRCMSGF